MLLMAGRGLASIATLLIPITLARVFDQADYGTYKQLFLIFTTLYSIALVGLSDSLYYFVPREPEKAGRYVANAVAGLTLSGVACLVALYAGRVAIAEGMRNGALAEHMGEIGLFLLFTLIATVLEIALIARKRYSVASSTYVASDLVRAVCFVAPALLWRDLGFLMAWAVAFSALRLVAALVLLKREFGSDFRLDRSVVPAQLAYATPFALYVLVEILQATYHQYAVSWTFDAATFAIYSVGCFQVPLVDFLATPASSVMMVRMAEELREQRPAEALAIWIDITRKLALIFFPLVAFLMIASRDIITFLFTNAYAASAPIFAVWVSTIALSVIQTDGVMRVYAQVPFLFKANLVRLALVVLLVTPSMAVLGLYGPVLVTLLAMAVAKSLHLVRMRRLMAIRAAQLLPWRSLAGTVAVSAASVIPAMAARTLVSGPAVVTLAAEATAFALTYLALALFFGLIDANERASLTHAFRLSPSRPLAAGVTE